MLKIHFKISVYGDILRLPYRLVAKSIIHAENSC